MSVSGAVDNASMAAPGTVTPGLPDMDSLWEEIDLTGKEMKPFCLPPVIKSGFPWLPVYLATSGDFQGLIAHGRTITETLEIARDVVKKLIEAHSENGGNVRKLGDQDVCNGGFQRGMEIYKVE